MRVICSTPVVGRQLCAGGDLPEVLWEDRGKERLQAPHRRHRSGMEAGGRAGAATRTCAAQT